MNPPHVSILLPVRNEERHLSSAIDSIRRQSLAEWELIAVDDGSTDDTPAILARYAAADQRIRIITSPARGIVAALNAGLAACRGGLVARMDGDDISHPRRLELQARVLTENPQVGLVACSFRHFPRNEIRLGMLAYETWQNSLATHEDIVRDLYVESPFVHPSVMYRKEAVEALGGYREMGWAEDYDLWLRMAAAGVLFHRSPQSLFFWRERPERATRTSSDYSAEAFRACKAHHLCRTFLAGAGEVVLAGAGKEGRAWFRALQREDVKVVLWIDVDPRKIGRTLHGVRVGGPVEVSPATGKMLITVGTRGARKGVRDWAINAGFREGLDFVCVT